MAKIPELAAQEGCNPYPDGGFRVVTNTGKEGGQEVHHLHFHVIPRYEGEALGRHGEDMADVEVLKGLAEQIAAAL